MANSIQAAPKVGNAQYSQVAQDVKPAKPKAVENTSTPMASPDVKPEAPLKETRETRADEGKETQANKNTEALRTLADGETNPGMTAPAKNVTTPQAVITAYKQ